MRRSPAWLWLAATAVGASALAWSGPAALRGARSVRAERLSLAEATVLAEELARLEASLPAVAAPGSPAPVLPQRVSEVLARCGLEAGVMSGFSSEGSGGTAARAVVTLAGATLPDLGKVLEAWREAEPAWTVESIELTPLKPPTSGGHVPLRAVVVLVNTSPVTGVQG